MLRAALGSSELQELAAKALMAQQPERAVEILERIVALDPEEVGTAQLYFKRTHHV